jgi:hypothetical protein
VIGFTTAIAGSLSKQRTIAASQPGATRVSEFRKQR